MPSTGVNFAYGGSGLFYTYGPEFVNISTQIDQFQQISRRREIDYTNSLVLFVYGGNDYSTHLQKSGRKVIHQSPPESINQSFISSRINHSINHLQQNQSINLSIDHLLQNPEP
jgi:hypothetical protein